ncbi:hypothetical protein ACJJTC_011627 [Scirpophaga incertulas]
MTLCENFSTCSIGTYYIARQVRACRAYMETDVEGMKLVMVIRFKLNLTKHKKSKKWLRLSLHSCQPHNHPQDRLRLVQRKVFLKHKMNYWNEHAINYQNLKLVMVIRFKLNLTKHKKSKKWLRLSARPPPLSSKKSVLKTQNELEWNEHYLSEPQVSGAQYSVQINVTSTPAPSPYYTSPPESFYSHTSLDYFQSPVRAPPAKSPNYVQTPVTAPPAQSSIYIQTPVTASPAPIYIQTPVTASPAQSPIYIQTPVTAPPAQSPNYIQTPVTAVLAHFSINIQTQVGVPPAQPPIYIQTQAAAPAQPPLNTHHIPSPSYMSQHSEYTAGSLFAQFQAE